VQVVCVGMLQGWGGGGMPERGSVPVGWQSTRAKLVVGGGWRDEREWVKAGRPAPHSMLVLQT
jgi:hypothetical protein